MHKSNLIGVQNSKLKPNTVYIRVNTGWDPLVKLSERPTFCKDVKCTRVNDTDGNLLQHTHIPHSVNNDFYGSIDTESSTNPSSITLSFDIDGAVSDQKLICIDTNDSTMKSTTVGNGTFDVTSKSFANGVYANYYWSSTNRGAGFLTNIKSLKYQNKFYNKELIQVGCPETGSATVNMPPFVDVNSTCYNFYSEYEADTGKFVRSVMMVIQEGTSVNSIDREFCIRTKRNFNTPIIFEYGPHEDNTLRNHIGGSEREVVANRYYVSNTPLFTLDDLQTPDKNILFYLFDPNGTYKITIDIPRGEHIGGTGSN